MHTVRAMKSRGAVVARSMLDLWLAEGIIRLFLQAFWRTARVTTGLGCILLIASHKHLHASYYSRECVFANGHQTKLGNSRELEGRAGRGIPGTVGCIAEGCRTSG